MLPDVQVADVDGGLGDGLIPQQQFRPPAPGQELGVLLDLIHQFKHLNAGIRHQYGLNDFGHFSGLCKITPILSRASP